MTTKHTPHGRIGRRSGQSASKDAPCPRPNHLGRKTLPLPGVVPGFSAGGVAVACCFALRRQLGGGAPGLFQAQGCPSTSGLEPNCVSQVLPGPKSNATTEHSPGRESCRPTAKRP